MIEEDALNIFTDGSSTRSPRNGGVGIRFVTIGPDGYEDVQDIQFSGYKNATNNQMELKACALALQEAIGLYMTELVSKVLVFTDSTYVSDNHTKAMFQWPKTRWLNRHGRPVLNADLWKELIRYQRKIRKRVEIRWVKGHSKNHHNRAADRMARQSARMAVNKPLSIVHVRRKLSEHSVDVGSVEMQGQRLSIRIVTTEQLKVHKLWKCKYEVISRASKFYGNVDIIFSDTLLSAGHCYFVKVNHDTHNPRVEKQYRELAPR